MSIPAGVTTVSLCAVPTGTFDVASATIQITPSADLIWSATGQTLASMCNTYPQLGWVTLPAVDQAGFITPDTRTGVTGWTYLITVSWTFTDGTTATEHGTIQVWSNQTIDYLIGSSGTVSVAPEYPVGGIALNGWVATYSALPTGLTAAQAGYTLMVQADQRMYVWSGSAWPANGQGFSAGGPPGPTGPTGAVGPANTLSVGSVATGSPISVTITGSAPNQTISFVLPEGRWWTGTGAPGTITNALSGDMYIDNSGTGNIYQLQSGVWVAQGSLLGPAGPTGATGQRGSEWFTGSGAPGTVAGALSGDLYLVTSTGTYYTYNGTSWTSQGSLLGPTGPTGPTGASSTWHVGTGAPSSGLGANGDMYLNTATGDIYGPKTSGAWGSIAENIVGPSAPQATSSTQGTIQLGGGDLGGSATAVTVPGKVGYFIPTVKTANYTATASDFVAANAASGTFTVTFPTAPADKTRIAIKKVDSSTNAVSLALGGSDVFNASGGPTTGSLTLQNQALIAQYVASSAIWYVQSTDVPLSGLDSRYVAQTTQVIAGTGLTGGGALSSNQTLAVTYGTAAGTAAQGNDSRITGAAPAASPTFTGTVTVPTPTTSDNSTKAASTAYVQANLASYAPLASPTLTGTPAAPTATVGDSSTKIATTAFVATSFAPLASPALTGTPTVPTASSGTNTTQAASTAFVQTAAQITGGTIAMKSSQTSAYTAAAGDFVPCSASSAAFTVTLPTAPSNGTRVTVMKTDTSTNAVTVSRGGSSDVINVAAQTSLTLANYLSSATLEYSGGTWYNQESSAPAHQTYLVQGGTRQTGYGDFPEGTYIPQAMELLAVQFRIGTADASGTSAAQLYSNTSNASTGTAISGASVASAAWNTANTHTLVTGPWAIAAGTYIQCDVTSVGTTPGNRLYVDLIGVWL